MSLTETEQENGFQIFKVRILRSFAKIISYFWVPFVFYFFYIIVNAILGTYTNSSIRSENLYLFLTSWFNPTEDLLHHNPVKGFIENFIIPSFIMIIYLIYYDRSYFAKKFNLSLGVIFLSGIFGTYLMSGILWIFSNINGTGTSIIAFCLLADFSVLLILDAKYYRNNERLRSYFLLVSSFALVYFLIAGYILGNSSFLLHIFGFGFSIPLLEIFRRLRNKYYTDAIVPTN